MKYLMVVVIMTTVGSFCTVWRDTLEGADGYPAGKMFEISLQRTNKDQKLEMFQWNSEFIVMLGVTRYWETTTYRVGSPYNNYLSTVLATVAFIMNMFES